MVGEMNVAGTIQYQCGKQVMVHGTYQMKAETNWGGACQLVTQRALSNEATTLGQLMKEDAVLKEVKLRAIL